MKKLLCTILTLVLLFTFTAVPMAAEVAKDAWDLFQYWETNGYPDDVGGVYFDAATDGLVITLVGADEARREEILSMLESTENLSFGESKYSYNEMRAVQEEITKDMTGGNGIYGAGIGWTSNDDGVITGFGESGKEFRIVVSVDKSVVDDYTTAFADKYGDMVYVKEGEAPITLQESIAVDDLTPDTFSNSNNHANTWLVAAVFVLLLAALSVLMLRRRYMIAAAQTTAGTTTYAQRLSRKEVIKAVKESELSPSKAAHKKLMDRLQE